jgi:hypothetical protein
MMPRLFAAIAAAMLMPGTAHAMDCCKDGKCACCAPNDETKPTTQGDHQH